MKPQPKHQPLCFTPRTPWGTRLPGTSFFDHLHASEDDTQQELDTQGTPKGLSGQIQYDGFQRAVPGSLSGQLAPNSAGGAADQMWKTPDTRKQQNELMKQHAQHAQQTQPSRTQEGPLSAANQEKAMQATLHQWSNSSPVVFGKGEPDTHVEGNVHLDGESGLRLGSGEIEAGLTLPRGMNTTFDPLVRGTPPPTKKRSGAPLLIIDKRHRQYYKDPEKK